MTPGSGKKRKGNKSIHQLVAIEEKATKERDAILDKFKTNSLAGGPFANKVKKLRKTFDQHRAYLADRHDEASTKALAAWSDSQCPVRSRRWMLHTFAPEMTELSGVLQSGQECLRNDMI